MFTQINNYVKICQLCNKNVIIKNHLKNFTIESCKQRSTIATNVNIFDRNCKKLQKERAALR